MVIRRILVPTDFSPPADLALETAIGLARLSTARVTVVHVSTPVMVLPPPFELIPIPTVFPDLPRRIAEALEVRAARVREAGLPVETDELSGAVHVEIIRYAKETGADLLVMGSHGHGALGHAVLGSVVERVLHRAPCPVVVVPPKS